MNIESTTTGAASGARSHTTAGDGTIELDGVGKSYGDIRVLKSITMTLRAGEVHAVVGENGAGKSTLMKIISGAARPTTGALRVDGEDVSFSSPHDARQRGISLVSQELSLLPLRSVLDNVLAGVHGLSRWGVVSRRRSLAKFRELASLGGFALDPDVRVGDLSLPQQEYVEILRGLANDARAIILDEPTTSMTRDQADAVLALIRQLAARGMSVVFISHALEDVLAVADTITVLRDGRLVRTRPAAEYDRDSLIADMIGRPLDEQFPPLGTHREDAEVVLAVDDLSAAGGDGQVAVSSVSLTVRAGEILGVGGLVGSGRSELLLAIAGANQRTSGRVEVFGRALPRGFRAAKKAGIAVIPESRKTQGLHLDHSLEANIVLPHLHVISALGIVASRRARVMAQSALDSVGVKTGRRALVRSLSGGNQQRVLFAKWMVERPRLLLVDEPTRGVDIAGKRAIYDLIAAFAESGGAVVVVSSELPELIGLSHRALVMARGRVVAELKRHEITEENVMRAAFARIPREER